MGFFSRIFSKEKKETLDKGLEKTKTGFFDKLKHAVAGRKTIDDDFLDDLEMILLSSDVGPDTTLKIIDLIRDRVARDKYVGTDELNQLLMEEITGMLVTDEADDRAGAFEIPANLGRPYVILVVGVNGAGKTTTIGKIAYQYKEAGYKVILGAGDTFRAAAIEQLEEWGRRAGVPVVKKEQGSASSAVAYETVSQAVNEGYDVAIIDTAGRLHNKKALMDELSKIKKSMGKVVSEAPDEVLLVLDGSVGQNAFEQARQFSAATQVTHLAITKLDGTAKGGVVIGISDQMKIPVKYIGLGERIDQIQVFNKREFVESLFGAR